MTGEPGPWRAEQAKVQARLTAQGVANASHEARWMVEVASGLTAAELAVDDTIAGARARAQLWSMCERRIAGEPLQYVLGSWGFRDLDLMVDRRVLVPRPETEWLVEVAVREMASQGARRGRGALALVASTSLLVADLGTGSGAIALALAAELPDAQVWATDISDDALAVARANVAGHAASRVRLARGSWFEALPADMRGRFDLIVSNPPYLADGERASLAPDVVDHEPAAALFAGPTGLEAIDLLIGGAPTWLGPGGILAIELAPHQAAHARDRARHAGYGRAEIHDDLAGRARVLVAQTTAVADR